MPAPLPGQLPAFFWPQAGPPYKHCVTGAYDTRCFPWIGVPALLVLLPVPHFFCRGHPARGQLLCGVAGTI